MRILNLRFKNISALQGEWEIHFDRSPLSDTGIFAITGPNGAGKTTIIDCLTLALYGETSRIRQPGEQIMSGSETESAAEVSFTVNDDVYKALWRMHREKGLPAAPAEMKLFSVNGTETLIEENTVRVRSRIAELTGLDFKRFCRTVVLAQGEFAAFLKALDNERLEIIEKVMGPEMFEEYADNIVEKAGKAREKLNRLLDEMEETPAPAPEAFQKAREDVENHQNALAEIQEDIGTLEDRHQRIGRKKLLQRDYEDGQLALSRVVDRKEQMQEDIRLLEKSRKAAPLRKGMEELKALTENATAVKELLEAERTGIPSLKAEIETLEAEKAAAAQGLDAARRELDQRGPTLDQGIELVREIESAHQIFRDKAEAYEENEKAQKTNLQEQSLINEKITASEEAFRKTDEWLTSHPGHKNLDQDLPALRDLESRRGEIQRSLSEARRKKEEARRNRDRSRARLKKSSRKAEKLKRKADKFAALRDKCRKKTDSQFDGDRAEEITVRFEDCRAERRKLENLLKVGGRHRRLLKKNGGHQKKLQASLEETRTQETELAETLEQERNIFLSVQQTFAALAYEKQRKQLSPGDLCPLCGSPDHPFVSEGLPYEGDPKKAMKDQRKKVGDIQKRLNACRSRIGTLEKQSRETDTLQEEWRRLSLSEVGSETEKTPWSIQELKPVKKRIRDLKKENESLRSRMKKGRKFQKKSDVFSKKADRASAVFSEADMIRLRDENDFNVQKGILTALENEISEILKKETAVVEKMKALVETYGETLTDGKDISGLISRMEGIQAEYQSRTSGHGELKKEMEELKKKKEDLPEALKKLSRDSETLGGEIRSAQERIESLKKKREAGFGESDPLMEKQAVEDAIETQIRAIDRFNQKTEEMTQALQRKEDTVSREEAEYRRLESESGELEADLGRQALAAGFSGLDEIHTVLLPVEEQTRIEKERTHLNAEIESAKKRVEELRGELKHLEELPDAPDAEEIERLREGRKARETTMGDLETARQILERFRDEERRYRKNADAVAAQEEICTKLDAETLVSGSLDEQTLKERVRDEMVERLLERANRHLGELSGRYMIRRNGGDGLCLEIEDRHMGGVRRTPDTLSGGECFLMSLGMALGLSELACRKRRIESLFLDEGFGALDEENLYKVISILKNLKANGKLVGVISHVRKLEEEIPTRIHIRKLTRGTSRIELMA